MLEGWVRHSVGRFFLDTHWRVEEGRVLAIQFGDAAADALDWRLGRRQYVDARGDEGNEAVTAAFGKMRASSGSED